MKFSTTFTTLVAAVYVLALPVTFPDSSGLSLRSDEIILETRSGLGSLLKLGETAVKDIGSVVKGAEKVGDAAKDAGKVAKTAEKVGDAAKDAGKVAKTAEKAGEAAKDGSKVAKTAEKAAKDEANKAKGLASKEGKSAEQIKADRKDRKEQQAKDKQTAAEKAQAKPGYKSHDQKMKDSDKTKVSFSNGADKRLTDMGLHGKDRKDAKKYHKDVMKEEMKKNGAEKGRVVATAHEGGTVAHEKNHITAQFQDKKGNPIPSKWKDSKTGEEKTGEKNQHHVYTDDKKAKAPSSWNKAVADSKTKKAEEEAAKKKASDDAFKKKSEEAKKEGTAKGSTMSAEDKKAQRKAAKDAKKSGKK